MSVKSSDALKVQQAHFADPEAEIKTFFEKINFKALFEPIFS